MLMNNIIIMMPYAMLPNVDEHTDIRNNTNRNEFFFTSFRFFVLLTATKQTVNQSNLK